MTECLYPTFTADGSLNTSVSNDCCTLNKQITSDLDKYLQEAAERHEMQDNYFDGCHKSTNTSPIQQENCYLEEDKVNTDNVTTPLYQSLMGKTPAYIHPITRVNHRMILTQFQRKMKK